MAHSHSHDHEDLWIEKKTPLSLSTFSAAELGDCATLAKKVKYENVNNTDYGGYTVLHYTAQYGHAQATSLVLRKGAKVDGAASVTAPSDDSNSNKAAAKVPTPLHRAAFSGAATTVKLLIDARADLLAVDKSFGDMRTPLHKAAAGGHPQAVRLILTALRDRKLLEQGLAALDNRSLTPLQVAEHNLANKKESYESVRRWDSVAGGPPDWEQCVALLRQASSSS